MKDDEIITSEEPLNQEDKYVSEKTEAERTSASVQIRDKKQDIKYDTRDYVVEYLVDKFNKSEFYIPLEYQRNFIWGDKDKCYFIESILMGLPIPFMFFADTEDGRIEIVDGAQRVQTLVEFVQNDLELSGLSVLSNVNGFRFLDLDKSQQRKFLQTNIRVVFLEEGTTENTRQEIFKRINTGGIHVTPTEARRGASDGHFKQFIEECTKNGEFNSLAPRSEMTERRYEGFELVTRFFAYTDSFEDNLPGYDGNVAKYIDNYVNEMNSKWENDNYTLSLKEYKKRFTDMLTFAHNFLGTQGFRKTRNSKSTPRARFEALSVGISLALKINPELQISDSQWLSSDEFQVLIKSDAANNKSKLKKRIEYVRDHLLEQNDG